MKKTTKFLSLLLSFVVTIGLLVGCGDKATEDKKGFTPFTMEDREGTEFTVSKEINRIVSTAPSNTEVLMALGVGDKLVAIDKYSEDIEGINKDIPKIDFRNADAEAIISLNPDIIIASGHNKVGDEDPYALIKEAGIPVVYIPSSNSIEGIYEDINFISKVVSKEAEGKAIVDDMKKEIDNIKEIGNKITDKKSVYFEIGAGSQLFTFGKDTFLNEMIEVVGAKNVFGDEESWISVSPEAVLTANPDIILANTPGTNEAGKTAIEDIKSRDGWDTITAVKNGEVYQIDKNTSSRGSQNIVKALKEMAKAIYPDEYKDL